VCRLALEGSLRDTELLTPAGLLFRIVSDLDFALRAGLSRTYDDVTREEFIGLQVLHAERDKYQQEQLEESSGRGQTQAQPIPLPDTSKWHRIDR
jgi:hypothetical protein